MLFNYTSKEKKELNGIEAHFSSLLDKALNAYNDTLAEWEKLDKKAQQGKRELTDDEAQIATNMEKTKL